MPNTTEQTAIDFFVANAGYSFDPAKETAMAGRLRCATDLAKAEVYAAAHGWRYEWSEDYDDNTVQWQCMLFDTDTGDCLGSLHGIDLGDETPFQYGVGLLGSPKYKKKGRPAYCRVVEAELAHEAMP